jgi:tRNA(Ile)-lysidine synthase
MKSHRSLRLIEPTKFLRDFPPAHRYLIGFSGGRDSAALLHRLVDLGHKKLIVCHLNHQLRGRSSDADARFVEKLAAKYDVDLELGSANVSALAAKSKISIETAARTARYSFFAKVASRRRCHTIFLAHHADDLVETFLINLFRGAGLSGLGAMHEVSMRRVDHVDLTIVRPLLGVWRKEIDEYVRKCRLKFREDASNKNLTPLRNRLRGQVIPYLERTIARNIRTSIWRAALIAAAEENLLDMAVGDFASGDISVTKLRELPTALQRRSIQKWLRAQNVTNVGFEVIERVRSLLDRETRVAKINLPGSRHARRRAGKLFIE